MIQIWALRSRLEKQPTDLRQTTSHFGDRTLVPLLAVRMRMVVPFDFISSVPRSITERKRVNTLRLTGTLREHYKSAMKNVVS